MPLPKPHKGESQDDFMARCMHEAYGSGAPSDRTQEQAVAMCFDAWRSEHGGEAPPAKALFGPEDCPDPEDDENQDDYMDRCVEEVLQEVESEVSDDQQEDAENACDQKWNEYVHNSFKQKPGVAHFKTHSEEVQGMDFVLSDETPDRMG